MFSYTPAVTPAAKTHLDAHLAFFNDMSRSMFRTAQQFSDLNLQLVQTMMEEAAHTSHELMTANRPTEALSAAAQRAQPATDKLRAYQQHLTRIAADTQVELSKVAEEHVESTSRTAKALAEEVSRTTQDEAERALRAQQAAIDKFSDPFRQVANNARQWQDGHDHDVRTAPDQSTAAQSAAQSAQAAQAASQAGKQAGVRKEP